MQVQLQQGRGIDELEGVMGSFQQGGEGNGGRVRTHCPGFTINN